LVLSQLLKEALELAVTHKLVNLSTSKLKMLLNSKLVLTFLAVFNKL